jgi:hypothetical protein
VVRVTAVVNVTRRTPYVVNTERASNTSAQVRAVTACTRIRVTVTKSTVARRIRYHPRCRVGVAIRWIVTSRVRTAVRSIRPFGYHDQSLVRQRYSTIVQGRTRHVTQRISTVTGVVVVTLGTLVRLVEMLVMTRAQRRRVTLVRRARYNRQLVIVTITTIKRGRKIPRRRLISSLVVTTRRQTRAVLAARVRHLRGIEGNSACMALIVVHRRVTLNTVRPRSASNKITRRRQVCTVSR